jgi:hypothetical protein
MAELHEEAVIFRTESGFKTFGKEEAAKNDVDRAAGVEV